MKALLILACLTIAVGCRSTSSVVPQDPCNRIAELDTEIEQIRGQLAENSQRLDRQNGADRRKSLSIQFSEKTKDRDDARAACLRSLGSDDARLILDARARSNAGIANQDVSAVMAEIDSRFQATGGAGGFATSVEDMAEIFSSEFEMEPPVVYVRTPDGLEISESGIRAFETGDWRGGNSRLDGEMPYGGRYAAHWVKSAGAWKIRSEVFVTMFE